MPSATPSPNFLIMRPDFKDYTVDQDDFPYLRARPTWITPDENHDMIQNEINVFADGQKARESIGRSTKRSIQLKIKAISADHCSLNYSKENGWTIFEKGKSKISSNGTYVFMKNNDQINKREPSDLIPVF